jgi:hypothetical protein
MPHDPAWYVAKAQAIVDADALDGFAPLSKHAVELLLAVAILEGNAGDGMADDRGSAHDWGSVTLRLLTQAEHAALDVPPPLPPSSANRAAAQARTAGIRPENGVLWNDSRPTPAGPVPYWVWFCRAADDARGAQPFVRTICRTQAERDSLSQPGGTAYALADAMHRAGYYTGVSTNAAEDIATYAAGIQRSLAAVTAALANWQPSAADDVAPTDPSPPPVDSCKPEAPEVAPPICVEPADGVA